MTYEQISAIHKACPFEAFTLQLTDGSQVSVSHPELLLPSQNGRSFAVGGSDDAFRIVDVGRVSAIHMRGELDSRPKHHA
jgi:hypothetical protein